MHHRYYSTKLQVFQEYLAPRRVLVPEQVGVASPSHQKEKEKAGRLSCGYGNLLCGEKVALNVPHILSQCASRRTTQDALAARAYAHTVYGILPSEQMGVGLAQTLQFVQSKMRAAIPIG